MWTLEHWKPSSKEKTKRGNRITLCNPLDLFMDPNEVPSPLWLGFGAAFKYAIEKDARTLEMLKEMYRMWPFFRVTIDKVEMMFAKGDPGIAALYDKLLVSEDLLSFGEQLREKYEGTKNLLLEIIFGLH